MPDARPGLTPGGSSPEDLPFQKLGPYEVQKLIGSGGMGSVYLALDKRLKRKVALKVLTPEKAENQTLLRRFRAEAATAAQLRHENVVAIYDTGEDQGYNYITMEYIDGTDLQRLLDVRRRIPIRRSLEIVKQVAIALQHAEKSRIVHRDIKPANILITREGVVKLADLGLARCLEDALEGGITRAGMTVGTVDYMSPEQAQDSKAANCQSDIYSLGCTWYQMVTGKPPFPEGSLTNKLRDHAHSERPNPRDLNSDVPEGMVAVIQRMMAIKPQDRYQSPTQLLKELQNPNLLSESVGRKIFDEDRLSSEIAADKLFDEDDVKTEESIPAGRLHQRIIDDDAEDDDAETVEVEGTSNQPGGGGKPARVLPTSEQTGRHPTQSGKRQAVASHPPSTVSQKNSVRGQLDTRGRLSRREREMNDARSLQWRGLTGFSVIALAALVVLTAGIVWEQVKPYVIPGETVVSQDLKGEKIPPGTPPKENPIPPGNAGREAPLPSTTSGSDKPRPQDVKNGESTAQTVNSAVDWKTRLSALPPWVDQLDFPEDTLPRFSVGPGGSPESQALTLNDALASLGPGGGIIELAGDGPFPLRTAEISSSIVIIRAALGTRPTIALAPNPESQSDSLLRFNGGLVSLQGLSFHVPPESLTPSVTRSVISAHDSLLFLKECLIRLEGKSSESLVALRTSGSYPEPNSATRLNRLLIDRTWIDGDGLSAILVESPRIQAVVRNSLLTSGSAPTVTFRFPPGTQSGDSASLLADHSTLASKASAVRIEHQSSGKPASVTIVPTGVGLIESILASQSDEAVLVSSIAWPVDGSPTELTGPLRDFNWYSSGTVFSGWKHLLDVGTEDAVATNDPEKWLLQYRSAGELKDFFPEHWPPSDSRNPGASPLDKWRGDSLPHSKGDLKGCDVRLLASVQAPLPSVLLSRPAGIKHTFSGPQVKINAKQEDLGKKISESEWEDGTTFVVTGSGTRPTSPIVIRGKNARIQFNEDPPGLTIVPLAASFKTPSDAHQSLIHVTDGYLEIQNGKFLLSNSEKRKPQRFLSVERGGFALERTLVEIPLDESEAPRMIIDWQGTGLNRSLNTGIIRNSRLLAGAGSIAGLETGLGSLFVRNSLLVARDGVLDLHRIGDASNDAVSIDLEQSTLVAGRSIVRLAKSDGPAEAPEFRVFADSCIYAGLMWDRSKSPGTSMIGSADEASLKLIAWSENRCGYDGRIRPYLSFDSRQTDANPNQEFADWQSHWKGDSILAPLFKPGSISYVEGDRSTSVRLLPSSYELKSDSPAYRAGVNQLPIGVGKLEPVPPTRKSEQKQPRPKSPVKTPPRSPVPGL